MWTDALDFELPPELIAQEPPAQRTDARLMHYRRTDGSISHRGFAELADLLRPGDLLVFNDARVIPARFSLRKDTGGRIEGLFVDEVSPGRWRVMLKNARTATGRMIFAEAPAIGATVVASLGDGEYELEIASELSAQDILDQIGRMPLPPYIRRDKDHDRRDELDRSRYQTVFAQKACAVAAPTAALHFSPELLAALAERGIEKTFVTLHVGPGTFKPVTAQTLETHAMHVETYAIDTTAAAALNRAKEQGRRIIAVGTTAARVLESQPGEEAFVARSDRTGIFIFPPYQWKHVDALVTNFHLPRSTLIALVAALVGLDQQRRLYALAIEQRYRFFSYGDAMVIE